MLTSELTLCRNSKSRAYFLSLLVPLLCRSGKQEQEHGPRGSVMGKENTMGCQDENSDMRVASAGSRKKEKEGESITYWFLASGLDWWYAQCRNPRTRFQFLLRDAR